MNNKIFKKICIALSLQIDDLIEIFRLSGVDAAKSEISDYRVGVDHGRYRPMSSTRLLQFLDGLIIYNRGKKNEPTT